ncbi:MAG: hypothetical protein SX243_12735 [Acidobacteriota bacterium]|nr:hypothetical protein [Acidobacteriota bacterium]
MRILILLSILALLFPTTTPAQEPTPSQQHKMERIRALEAEIQELLDELPPELRRRIEAELEEMRQREPVPKPAVTAELPAEPEPSPPPLPDPPPAPVEPEPKPEESAEEKPAAEEPAEEAPTEERFTRSSRCNLLEVLDEDGDEQVDGGDAAWRFLYLWEDENGDGELDEKEVQSAFDRGVRSLSVSGGSYEDRKERLGLVRVSGGQVVLVLQTGGLFREGTTETRLAVDAEGLERAGVGQLLDAQGAPLDGIVLLEVGLHLRRPDGEAVRLRCR